MAPCRRISQPMPPPSVSPAIPVWVTMPPTVARPCACVAASSSPHSTPAPARAVRAVASTAISFIGDRSTTSPPSQTDIPAMLWPPPRTATGSERSRAICTAAATSAALRQRAMIAGWRSIAPFHTRRASS